MKYSTITILFFFFCLNCFSQKNEIAFGFKGIRYFNVSHQALPVFPTIEFTTITIKRKIYKNISVYANVNFRTQLYFTEFRVGFQLTENLVISPSVGEIIQRDKYNYYDLGLHCNIFNRNKHQLDLSTGISYTYGRNLYLDELYYIILSGGRKHYTFMSYTKKYEHYWGGVLSFYYTYNLTQRWGTGFTLAYRHHNNDFPKIVNHGIFAKLSF